MAILRFSTYYAMGMNYWKEKLFDWSIDMLFALLLSNILLQVLKGDQGSLWNGGKFSEKKNEVQMNQNDTYPTLCMLELTRILMDVKGLSWKEVWDIT